MGQDQKKIVGVGKIACVILPSHTLGTHNTTFSGSLSLGPNSASGLNFAKVGTLYSIPNQDETINSA